VPAAEPSVAVDPSNDHLFGSFGPEIAEFSSAAEGSTVIKSELGVGLGSQFNGIDVYGANHEIYVTGVVAESEHPNEPKDQRIFVFNSTSGGLVSEFDGSEASGGSFSFSFGRGAVAVDQANGDFYVSEARGSGQEMTIEQFDAEGKLIGVLPAPPSVTAMIGANRFSDVAVDDPCRTGVALDEPCNAVLEEGEAAYDSPNAGYVFVGSGVASSTSHLYAYKPRVAAPPAIELQEATEVAETEAVLRASLNPGGLDTQFYFEYVDEADFLATGYAGAARAPVPPADAGEGGAFFPVSEAITGLSPGATYHFRLVASNEEGTTVGEGVPGGEGEDGTFATYPTTAVQASCPNAPLRSGASANLPDCRAYELVTPAETNGRIPTMAEFGIGSNSFPTALVSPDGASAIFGTEGGALQGAGGGGLHDTYLVRRTAGGWQSSFAGLTGTQAQEAFPGGLSTDLEASFWEARGSNGSLAPGVGDEASYVRRLGGVIDPKCSPEPQGSFELVGCGSQGVDIHAQGKRITPGAIHTIFATQKRSGVEPVRLELDAAPSGTDAVYDRTADGLTHVVSLLPGDKPLGAGENAAYLGSSSDGSAVAFEVGGKMLVRLDGSKTVEVTNGETTFAGLSSDGGRLCYLKAGDIFSYDTTDGTTTAVGSGGESIVVNVSADGSHVYFISPKQLAGGSQLGADNLYVWTGSTVRFIAALDPTDVNGHEIKSKNGDMAGGLGLWVGYAVSPAYSRGKGPAADPSRSTPDGSVFVFESHADLTGYQSEGHSEVYRYSEDAEAGERLLCVSCDPTSSAPTSDARLESDTGATFDPSPPVNALSVIANVTADGNEVFFQSGDRLVARDTDRHVDVYEWQARGVEECAAAGGCLHLISSGRSASDDYLYAMTPDGHDVLFESTDLLAPQDQDGTPSIYDARVDGGFPFEAPLAPCEGGEACRPQPSSPPALPDGSTGAIGGNGNVRAKKHHHKRKHRHRHAKRRGGRHAGDRSKRGAGR
jgi:hypothetical protein